MLSLAEIRKLLQCESLGFITEREITGVSTDSRTIRPGELFFGIKGPNYDGSDWAKDALHKGASYAIISKRLQNDNTFYVRDTLKALGELAKYYRKKFKVKVVGISGANGKTTTKNILSAILSIKFNTVCSPKSYNNFVGLPLSLLKIKKDTEIAVMEFGISFPGEMDRLCEIASPDVGVITNIGPAHLEGLESVEKMIYEELKFGDWLKGGYLFVNGDIPELLNKALDKKFNLVTFGFGKGVDYRARDIKLHLSGSYFTVNGVEFSLPLLGRANILNVTAAISIANQIFEIPLRDMVKPISELKPEPMRMEIIKLKGALMINDAYNANPVSMKESLDYLSLHPNRKIAVIGGMLELGKRENEFHRDILSYAKKKADVVILAGKEGILYPKEEDVLFFERFEDAALKLKEILQPSDVVLFKASRGCRFEELIKLLEE